VGANCGRIAGSVARVAVGDTMSIAACAAVARATVQGFFGSEPSKVTLFATHIQDYPWSYGASLVPDLI